MGQNKTAAQAVGADPSDANTPLGKTPLLTKTAIN